ncbi:MAG: hypothetical protein JNK45_12700 [Myxococcales bacterium]|jgi:hypothetical protein|nr:hypothetical protein [Myxococcales bacterium]
MIRQASARAPYGGAAVGYARAMAERDVERDCGDDEELELQLRWSR